MLILAKRLVMIVHVFAIFTMGVALTLAKDMV